MLKKRLEEDAHKEVDFQGLSLKVMGNSFSIFLVQSDVSCVNGGTITSIYFKGIM